MEKKFYGIIIIISFLFFGACKTIDIVDKREFNPVEDKFVAYDGFKMPILSEEKKVFKETSAFKRARKRVIDPEEFVDYSSRKPGITVEEFYNEERKKHLVSIANNKDHFIDQRTDNLFKIYEFKNDKLEKIAETFKEQTGITDYFKKQIIASLETGIVYYPNGKIKSYSVYYSTGSQYRYIDHLPVGKWSLFDENGNVIREVDHEKLFKMKISEILDIAFKQEEVNRAVKMPFKVTRYFNNGNPIWLIHVTRPQGNYNEPETTLFIDDASGKVIDKFESKTESIFGNEKYKKYMFTETNKILYKGFDNN